MKPIRLTIQGLQSYREEQTIDFSRLAEAGVFGIFGPTGSGKSTILDAVTLAMYGSVERAGNSIQGIMNAQEDTLSVAFAFQLADGAGRRTYRVERTYRRKADGTVEQRMARLAEETPDGVIVMADKAGDVNDGVVSLIGLSMTDFTRAVVLPQGKFSEFLSLKGKDRRAMLERLFRLERYGDELAARLRSRLNRAEADAREAAAELAGLGDASPEALAAAEAAYGAAAAEEARLAAALAAAEAAHAEAARVREALAEAAAAAAELAALAARRPEIEALEARLAAAAAAETLLPVRRDAEQAAESEARSAAAFAEAERSLASETARHGAARETLAAAERTLAEREAPTAVRLEQLRQAEALEAQARADEAALQEKRGALETLAAERGSANDALASKREQRAKALELQASLKAELAANAVSAEERRRMAAAERDRSAAAALAEQARALRAEAGAASADAARRDREAAALAEAAAEAEAQLSAARDAVAQSAAALASAEAALQREERRLGDAIQAARTAAAGGEWRAWAHALAERLADGEPCPVCGSAHHPAPAQPAPEAPSAEAERLERELEAVREGAALARKEAGRVQEALVRLDAALPNANELTAYAEAAVGGDGAAARQIAPEEGRAALADVGRVAAHLSSVLPELRERLERLEALRGRLRDERAGLAAAVSVAKAAEAKAEQAERAAAEAALRWRETYPEWTAETFAEALEALERKERHVEELQQRLAKSEPYLESNAADIERLQQRLADADRRFATLAAEAAAAERRIAERRADIAALTGGAAESPSALSTKLSAELERWRADARAARAAEEAARAAADAAGKRLAAAEEALKAAADARERADRRWAEALGASVFDSADAVRAAALPPERREGLAREAAAYQEELASASARCGAAEARLAGRTLTEEEWAEAERRLREAKALREEALAARAKAERAVEELRAKHEQWLRLTRRHEEASALQQQLAKLQTVFRGNAFVEFLAEEQLLGVTRAASERLGRLTRGRYAIELDSTGGFVIRDDANGGLRRSVSTLSGGETFLTSLALALALSAQIQLSGKYPLEFFFLDEGFGTLDPELLDNVVTALEKLHLERLAVGVISHVPELQARLPRKLIVTPADPLGAGSRVRIETT